MSEGEDDQKDKPYEASRRKLEEARRKGEIVRSQDVVSLLVLTIFVLGLSALFGNYMTEAVQRFGVFVQRSTVDPAELDGRIIFQVLGQAMIPVFVLLFGIPFVVVMLGLISVKQILITPEKLQPKLSRISLISNAKKKFGLSGFVEFVKNTVKLIIFSVFLSYFLVNGFEYFHISILQDENFAISNIYARGLQWLFFTLGIFSVFAVIDALWQFHEHVRKNRMSHKELKDEHKNEEGDEGVRQQRRARAEEIATNRMLLDVPKATVVITNPTHFAVALQWDGKQNTAPKCVAKGSDETARRIRELAIQSGVPLYRDPHTARDLYANVKIGVTIDTPHYKAVAAAIGYARRIQNRMLRDR